MTIDPITRDEYNKRYRFRQVLTSDNIYLRHCGSCVFLKKTEGKNNVYWCFIMSRWLAEGADITVNRKKSCCNLWMEKQPKKGKKEVNQNAGNE